MQPSAKIREIQQDIDQTFDSVWQVAHDWEQSVHQLKTTILGGTHLFIPKFEPEEVLRTIQKHGATHCFMVPTMLMNVPNFDIYDLSSLQEIIYAGSPMPETVLEKAMQLLPDCRFVQAYGMTETSPCITFLEHHHHWEGGSPSKNIRSGGKPLFNVEARIVDA